MRSEPQPEFSRAIRTTRANDLKRSFGGDGQWVPRPTAHTDYWELTGMPVAPTVVITAVVRMPVAPPIVVAVRVVSVSNTDDYAETVSVMLVFISLCLSCAGAYQGQSGCD